MQNHLEEGTIARGRIPSNIRAEAICGLIEELRPLLPPCGVETEVLAATIEESLFEIDEISIGISVQECRLRIVGLVLRKLFARESALWINPQTKAGNLVSMKVLVSAYSVWKSASILAKKYRVDPISAADSLVRVTNDIADLISNNAGDSKREGIRHVCHYIYTAYTYSIRRIARKKVSRDRNSVNIAGYIAKRELSDKGVFRETLDAGLLCQELLDAMPPRGKSVAIARYILGYSWPEIADSLGSSINAAQKALSTGIRMAVEVYGQEISNGRSKKALNIKSRRLKRKNNRFCQKMQSDDAYR